MMVVSFGLLVTFCLRVSQIKCSFNKCYLKWFLQYDAVFHFFYSVIFYFDTCSKLVVLITILFFNCI